MLKWETLSILWPLRTVDFRLKLDLKLWIQEKAFGLPLPKKLKTWKSNWCYRWFCLSLSVEINPLSFDEERPYLKICIYLNSGRACDEICGEVGSTACGWQGGGDAADPGEQTNTPCLRSSRPDFLYNLEMFIQWLLNDLGSSNLAHLRQSHKT